MPDVSPTKWHLAHTSWFFETFILKVWMPSYRTVVPQYAYLFNSYYNAAGDMHRRDLRGLISRPTVAETYRFRQSIDAAHRGIAGKRGRRAARGNRAGLHDRPAPRTAAPGTARHRHQARFRAEPASSGFPGTERAAANGARLRPASFVDFEEAILEIGHDGAVSATIMKGRGIARSSPRFRSRRARSRTANISPSSKPAATSGRSSGCR